MTLPVRLISLPSVTNPNLTRNIPNFGIKTTAISEDKAVEAPRGSLVFSWGDLVRELQLL